MSHNTLAFNSVSDVLICNSKTYYIEEIETVGTRSRKFFTLNEKNKPKEFSFNSKPEDGQFVEMNCFKNELVFMNWKRDQDIMQLMFFRLKDDQLVRVGEPIVGNFDGAFKRMTPAKDYLWVQGDNIHYRTADFKKWESLPYSHIVKSDNMIIGEFCDANYNLQLKFHIDSDVKTYKLNEKCPPPPVYNLTSVIALNDSYLANFSDMIGEEIPLLFTTYKLDKKSQKIERLKESIGEYVIKFKDILLREEKRKVHYSTNEGKNWKPSPTFPYGSRFSDIQVSGDKLLINHRKEIFESTDGILWKPITEIK